MREWANGIIRKDPEKNFICVLREGGPRVLIQRNVSAVHRHSRAMDHSLTAGTSVGLCKERRGLSLELGSWQKLIRFSAVSVDTRLWQLPRTSARGRC